MDKDVVCTEGVYGEWPASCLQSHPHRLHLKLAACNWMIFVPQTFLTCHSQIKTVKHQLWHLACWEITDGRETAVNYFWFCNSGSFIAHCSSFNLQDVNKILILIGISCLCWLADQFCWAGQVHSISIFKNYLSVPDTNRHNNPKTVTEETSRGFITVSFITHIQRFVLSHHPRPHTHTCNNIMKGCNVKLSGECCLDIWCSAFNLLA